MKLILILLCSFSVSAFAAETAPVVKKDAKADAKKADAKKPDKKAAPAKPEAPAKPPAKAAPSAAKKPAAKPVAAKPAAKSSRAPASTSEVQFASEKVGSTTVVCGYLKNGNAISCVNAK
jgi:hypothetical protein